MRTRTFSDQTNVTMKVAHVTSPGWIGSLLWALARMLSCPETKLATRDHRAHVYTPFLTVSTPIPDSDVIWHQSDDRGLSRACQDPTRPSMQVSECESANWPPALNQHEHLTVFVRCLASSETGCQATSQSCHGMATLLLDAVFDLAVRSVTSRPRMMC